MERVIVAVAADANFCRQLAVVISGIARSAAGVAHTVYVLHDGYDAALMDRVAESTTESVELRWIDARSSALDSANLPTFLPPAALYRLRLEELVPADTDRVIYLDTDTVVRDSLLPLWHVDLGDALVAAVRDPVFPWAAAPQCIEWSRFGLPPDMPYFNSGMLVIPLEAWRTQRVSERALELLAHNRFRYADQCALNVIAAGNWLQLEPRWNLQAGHLTPDGSLAWIVEAPEVLENARRDPAVVHFTHNTAGWVRPWEPRSTYPNRDLWFEELEHTAWKRWRPDESWRKTKGVARRFRRASRVLVDG